MLRGLVVTLLAAAASARQLEVARDIAPVNDFMSAKVGSVPALQPSEVFDQDFPLDGVKLTPEELRYKAQADYARAIAMLKREKAEADAAEKAMRQALQNYKDSLAAAKRAKQEAADALKNKKKYGDAAVDAETHAKVANASAVNHEAVVKQEKADLVKAEAAYKAANKGAAGSEAKIEKLSAKRAELTKKIKALEAESDAMGHTLAGNKAAANKQKGKVDAQNGEVEEAQQTAAEKAAELTAAAKLAKESQDALAEAKKAASYSDEDAAGLKDNIAEKQKDFDDAEATYMREKTDAEMAMKQVERAKKELAKFEERPRSGGEQVRASLALFSMVATATALF